MIIPVSSGGSGVPRAAANMDMKLGTFTEFSPDVALSVHALMLQARVFEERLIAMYKQGDGYFWVGGPGEEAFNIPLGLLVNKGQGLDHDFLHLHYRSAATLLAMGADPVDSLRQMKNTATDPYSRGRNFVGHASIRKWNVAPISSPIEVQFSIAIGTAEAQRKTKSKGITIVQGGDAGTAEGDFSTCLVWSSRKGSELPILILVANNKYGISTPYEGQHGEVCISDRGKAFKIRGATIDGNDPEVSWAAIGAAMHYVRTERKPFLLEAMVSRLHGHSSASGANFVKNEIDCIARFEHKLEERGLLTRAQMNEMRAHFTAELLEASKRVRKEPQPLPETIWDYVYADKNRREVN
ncbi:MAG: thiamine pyrophosphate-dependent dehydrogenase E1 component subunit alpha [Polyangiaceae bacterium]|nr:thiamine pyrophosphate-dependent dehydrogenase E1 component subunit alpha [Polyangiaceae bacterium]